MNIFKRNLNTKVAWLGLMLLVSGLLVACGDNPTAVPTATAVPPTPTPVVLDPKAIAKKAADKINALNTIHFTIDIKAGQVTIYKGITFKKADGSLLKPDKYQAKLRVSVAIAQVDADTIGIGDKQWLLLKNLSTNWQELPADVGFKASVLFDPNKGLSAVVTKINNIEMDGSETIDGADCYKLKGIVSGADIAPLTASTLGKNDVDFEVWIGKSDSIARQVTFKERSTDPNASNWQLNFSKFDEPVDIKSPV